MQTVDSCCCGCTLRTGTLILLWLGVVSSGLSIFSGITNAVTVKQNDETPIFLFEILINAIALGIYIFGIIGVKNEKPSYLKPYLGYQILGMAVVIILMIALPIFGAAMLSYVSSVPQNDKDGTEQVASSIVLGEIACLLTLGLQYYFFIVVLSFYKDLKNQRGIIQQ